jgi:hypothetical protein
MAVYALKIGTAIITVITGGKTKRYLKRNKVQKGFSKRDSTLTYP